ncbi:RNA polymerase sigma factor, partial [bacterium]|nr:RNA polymerase sigma factor [bacterium]
IPLVNVCMVLLNTVQKTVNDKGQDDRELIRQFKDGKESAFSQLVEKHQKKIYHLARRIVLNHLDADEVVQETFIKVYKYIDRYSEEFQFNTWLYRIAINTALTLIKKRKHGGRSLEELSENEHYEPAGTDDTQQLTIDNEMYNRVKMALETLSPELRSVFVLRTWDEMSYREIARTLHISEGTVMSRLNRARNKLKIIIGEWDNKKEA